MKKAPREVLAQEDHVTRAINELCNEMATRIEAISASSKSKPMNKPMAGDSPSRNMAAKGKSSGKEKCTCFKCHQVGNLAAYCKLSTKHIKMFEKILALNAVTSEEGQDF